MHEIPIQLPVGQLVKIIDSDLAYRYIQAFELLGAVRHACQLPEPAVCVTSANHETHWLHVRVYRGYEKPEDNGLVFMAYPKDGFTFEAVREIILRDMGSGDYTEITVDPE